MFALQQTKDVQVYLVSRTEPHKDSATGIGEAKERDERYGELLDADKSNLSITT